MRKLLSTAAATAAVVNLTVRRKTVAWVSVCFQCPIVARASPAVAVRALQSAAAIASPAATGDELPFGINTLSLDRAHQRSCATIALLRRGFTHGALARSTRQLGAAALGAAAPTTPTQTVCPSAATEGCIIRALRRAASRKNSLLQFQAAAAAAISALQQQQLQPREVAQVLQVLSRHQELLPRKIWKDAAAALLPLLQQWQHLANRQENVTRCCWGRQQQQQQQQREIYIRSVQEMQQQALGKENKAQRPLSAGDLAWILNAFARVNHRPALVLEEALRLLSPEDAAQQLHERHKQADKNCTEWCNLGRGAFVQDNASAEQQQQRQQPQQELWVGAEAAVAVPEASKATDSAAYMVSARERSAAAAADSTIWELKDGEGTAAAKVSTAAASPPSSAVGGAAAATAAAAAEADAINVPSLRARGRNATAAMAATTAAAACPAFPPMPEQLHSTVRTPAAIDTAAIFCTNKDTVLLLHAVSKLQMEAPLLLQQLRQWLLQSLHELSPVQLCVAVHGLASAKQATPQLLHRVASHLLQPLQQQEEPSIEQQRRYGDQKQQQLQHHQAQRQQQQEEIPQEQQHGRLRLHELDAGGAIMLLLAQLRMHQANGRLCRAVMQHILSVGGSRSKGKKGSKKKGKSSSNVSSVQTTELAAAEEACSRSSSSSSSSATSSLLQHLSGKEVAVLLMHLARHHKLHTETNLQSIATEGIMLLPTLGDRSLLLAAHALALLLPQLQQQTDGASATLQQQQRLVAAVVSSRFAAHPPGGRQGFALLQVLHLLLKGQLQQNYPPTCSSLLQHLQALLARHVHTLTDAQLATAAAAAAALGCLGGSLKDEFITEAACRLNRLNRRYAAALHNALQQKQGLQQQQQQQQQHIYAADLNLEEDEWLFDSTEDSQPGAYRQEQEPRLLQELQQQQMAADAAIEGTLEVLHGLSLRAQGIPAWSQAPPCEGLK
ncbi:hypothetical protein, conserved [Eimeria tenella]|uniref:Uncharacterized protein n=1 Tax=Eimeria tenella TaxID=5802 RepID=U6L2W9_EIMTE|nr:hypothetical protein, conserved [Eimeria tenella]CDJ42120.1 hypothetical protein, conserved [Eimeria tenella]|eukprot:XP_013232870.1 hypothetical protein, conserved [Eimeria tenella]